MRADFLLLLLLSVPFTRFAPWIARCVLRCRKSTARRLGKAGCGTPDLNTQDAILRQTEELVEPADRAIDRARHEIELLREYRTRLIADVVTGKLDVREAAADLPEVDPANLEDIIEIDDAVADELDSELEEVGT